MKTIAAIILLTACTSFAANEWVTLKTVNGVEYKNAKLSKIEPDGIRIMHDGGFAKIAFVNLPPEISAQFKFNQEEAEKFQAERQAKIAEEARRITEEKVRRAKKDNAVAASQQSAPVNMAVATTANEEQEETKLPAPLKGRLYEVKDIRAQKADLNGKVVRVELEVNWLSEPEQNDDGSYKVFVGGENLGEDNYSFVIFPPEAKRMVEVMLNTKRGKMNFYALINKGNPFIYPVGRNFRPVDSSNLVFAYSW